MQTNQLISPDYILRNVAVTVDDTEYKKGVTKGWMEGRLRTFLNEIGFDAQFQVNTIDADIPSNFRYLLPNDLFDLREIYVWNGTCCTPSCSVRMRWKRDFNNYPNGQGYTAIRKDDTQSSWVDAFNPPYSGVGGGDVTPFPLTPYPNTTGTPYTNATPQQPSIIQPENVGGNGSILTNVFYYNIQSGYLMFSSNCTAYKKFRIVYSQTPVAFGATPFVPVIFERGAEDYLTMVYYKRMASVDARTYVSLYKMAIEEFYNPMTGSYWKCRDRVVKMNRSQREDLNEYISRPNIGSFGSYT